MIDNIIIKYTGADSYATVKRMACYYSKWKAANKSKD
jgi:hypothetical protein